MSVDLKYPLDDFFHAAISIITYDGARVSPTTGKEAAGTGQIDSSDAVQIKHH